MPEPFVGEIRMFAGNFPPAGWAFCEGQPLPISENEILFQLIGTTFGGDGESTFNLPDLRGRVPVHQGTGGGTTYTLGESGGVEQVTLTVQQIPTHTHAFLASTATGTSPSPVDNVLAANNVVSMYKATTPMNAAAAGPAGGSQPHENLQPYLCIDFIISLFGVFPSPT
jgi:microcystin-dependent protein